MVYTNVGQSCTAEMGWPAGCSPTKLRSFVLLFAILRIDDNNIVLKVGRSLRSMAA